MINLSAQQQKNENEWFNIQQIMKTNQNIEVLQQLTKKWLIISIVSFISFNFHYNS